MQRRHVMLGAGAVAGGVATGAVATGAAAQADNRGGVTGSWLITHQDAGDATPVTAVASFAAGGVLISHDISPAGPPGTGTWESRGRDRFRGTFWTGFPGEGGPGTPGPTLRVRVEGRVQGDTISGTFAFTVFDPSGAQTDSGTGTFRGSRIEA